MSEAEDPVDGNHVGADPAEEDQSEHNSEELTLENAKNLLEAGKIEKALNIFKIVLENDPDNLDAQEGFRQAYTALLKKEGGQKQEEISDGNKTAVLIKSLELLEIMRRVVRKKRKEKSRKRRLEED
jgi:hypothetical protein